VAKNVTGAGSATGAGSETRTEGATKEGEVNPEEQQESFSRNEIVAEKGEGRKPHSGRAHLHDAVLLSLTGAKGAITLALVLTIPLTLADGSPFPERDLIIFLASGVILLSLLFANFLVPLIAPKKAAKLMPEHEVAATLDIYRMVITRLVDTMQSEQKGATEEVIRQYYERIRRAKKQNTAINERDALVRMRIIEWERDHTLELIEQDKVSTVTGMFYLDHLSRILARLKHHSTLQWELKGLVEQIRHRLRHARQRRAKGKQKLDRGALREITRLELRDLTLANYRYVQEKLEDLARQQTEDAATTRAAALVLVEFERRVARFDNLGIHRGDSRKEHERQLIEVEARALEYEREAINDALEGKRISRATAKEMRDNVAMMELDIEEQLE
jgi:CPA1 family monovalent cation:H+ antiporter